MISDNVLGYIYTEILMGSQTFKHRCNVFYHPRLPSDEL